MPCKYDLSPAHKVFDCQLHYIGFVSVLPLAATLALVWLYNAVSGKGRKLLCG